MVNATNFAFTALAREGKDRLTLARRGLEAQRLIIRRAVPRDAEAIAKLSAAFAGEDGGVSMFDVDRIRSHGFGNNALFEIWVAEDNRKLVSHAVITKGFDVRRGLPLIVLCELYVSPEARRGGLARRMMSSIARRAMDFGARDLTITTGVDNAVAQRFFAAIGADRQQAHVFQMSADGIQWLATEGL
jgi:GNAT superfamily N-acetyltransferase